MERQRRSTIGTQKIHVFSGDQKVPRQRKKFLNCGENKESLVQFLCPHWQKYISSRFHNLELFATCKSKCYHFYPSPVDAEKVIFSEVCALNCSHEEADTRLL